MRSTNSEYIKQISVLQNEVQKQHDIHADLEKQYKFNLRELELSKKAPKKDYFALQAVREELSQLKSEKLKKNRGLLSFCSPEN